VSNQTDKLYKLSIIDQFGLGKLGNFDVLDIINKLGVFRKLVIFHIKNYLYNLDYLKSLSV